MAAPPMCYVQPACAGLRGCCCSADHACLVQSDRSIRATGWVPLGSIAASRHDCADPLLTHVHAGIRCVPSTMP